MAHQELKKTFATDNFCKMKRTEEVDKSHLFLLTPVDRSHWLHASPSICRVINMVLDGRWSYDSNQWQYEAGNPFVKSVRSIILLKVCNQSSWPAAYYWAAAYSALASAARPSRMQTQIFYPSSKGGFPSSLLRDTGPSRECKFSILVQRIWTLCPVFTIQLYNVHTASRF